MSDALLFGALLLALVGLLASRLGPERLPRIIPGVSWLGLIVGFGAQAGGLVTDLRGAVGTALFAGLAVAISGGSTERRDALGGASAVVLVGAGVGALALPADPVNGVGHLMLLSAQISAVVALLAGLVGAAAARTSNRPAGLALAAVGAIGGGAIVGFLRSSLPQSSYSVPLRTSAGEPVYWSLPGVEGLPEGLRLTAVLDIPAMPWIVGAGIGLGIIAAGLEVLRRNGPAIAGWALVGAVAAGALGVLHIASTEARLPGSQRYEDTTRQVLRDVKAEEALLQRASFTGGDAELAIARQDMAPEFFGFGLAGLLALLALTRRVGPFAREEDKADDAAAELLQRDQFVRTAAFGWLSLLAAGLVHMGYFGVAWVGSASEWSALGVLFVVTGLAVTTFDRRKGHVADALRRLAPGVAAAIVLLVLGLGYAFGVPFAMSMNAY